MVFEGPFVILEYLQTIFFKIIQIKSCYLVIPFHHLAFDKIANSP